MFWKSRVFLRESLDKSRDCGYIVIYLNKGSFTMKHIVFLCLFAVMVCAYSADLLPAVQYQQFSDRAQIDSVLVSVNGEPITLLDVILETASMERRLVGILSGERLVRETHKIRKEAIESIILYRLLYLEYKKKPFTIPPQEVENMLDAVAADMGDGTRATLEKQLKNLGFSTEKLKVRLREKIATEALLGYLCDRKVYITPKEVYDEYKAHPEKWGTPARISLQLLQVLRGENAANDLQTIQKKIKAGEDFTALVKQFSNAPTAASGGFIGSMEQNKLRPEFAAALTNTAVGQIAGPVETPEAWYFIRVAERSPARLVPFKRVADQIERSLMEAAWKKNREAFSKELRSKAIVRYYFQ